MHEITELSNGLRIVTRTLADTESVTVNFFIGAGGRYEDMKSEYGASHFLEHLLFKGTHKRPSAQIISEEVDSVGGYMNAYTSEDHTSYYIKLPKNYFGLAFNILSDIITDPLLEEEQINRERKVILEEMKVYKDDPARYVFDFVGDLLWPDSTLRTNVIGTEQIISTMERKTIKDYFEQMYGMNNIVISVAGNVTHQQVLKIAKGLMQKIQHKTNRTFLPVQGSIAKDKVFLLHEDSNQAHLVICGRAPYLDAPDEPAIKVLSTLLGSGMSSRLFLNVREQKGLAYSIYSSITGYSDSGKFEIYAGVNHSKINQAIRAIREELQKIRTDEVEAKELAKAKEQLRGRYIMGLESNAAVADMQGSHLLLTGKIRPLSETLKQIDAVTPAEVLAAAQRYFQPDDLRLAIIGPFDSKEKFERLMEE
jgi:predicted Zn-dependent peptidase